MHWGKLLQQLTGCQLHGLSGCKCTCVQVVQHTVGHQPAAGVALLAQHALKALKPPQLTLRVVCCFEPFAP